MNKQNEEDFHIGKVIFFPDYKSNPGFRMLVDPKENYFTLNKNTYTNGKPNKEGYYWYYSLDQTECTPCILKVTKDKHDFWAQDEEFCFVVSLKNDNEFWCKIDEPELPKNIIK